MAIAGECFHKSSKSSEKNVHKPVKARPLAYAMLARGLECCVLIALKSFRQKIQVYLLQRHEVL